MDLILRVVSLLTGIAITGYALFSAIRTFILPRSARDRLTTFVFRRMRGLLNLLVGRSSSYEVRDRVMAYLVPFSLLALQVAWLVVATIGYSLIYWGMGDDSYWHSLGDSGSSLFTLGFVAPNDTGYALVSFTEAALGLILVALLIAYLPTLYSAFSKREAMVTMLEVRAGSPPSAVELITRFHRLNRLDKLVELWEDWEIWFTELGETHTSLPMLTFYRSPDPDHSWVTAAGVILDSASLVRSALDVHPKTEADLCIRAGYIALRRIADYFRISYESHQRENDPLAHTRISISRAEFDAACDQLVQYGVPVKTDRDTAWQDFAGWRVNYDSVLLDLAGLVMAPVTPWVSDRSSRFSQRVKRRIKKA